jgi:hypothetical protein
MNKNHQQLRQHLERFVDRARWPDYILTDADLEAYIRHESTGKGVKPEPLAWVKKCEEITINQLWSEMAEYWSNDLGFYYPLAHTIRCEWSERKGSNIWIRKILTIAKGIRRDGFLSAFLKYTGLSDEEKKKYLAIKFPR